MSETDASIAGEAHLNTLRKYSTRMSALICQMESYAVLKVAQFGPDEQARCKNSLRAATIVLGVLGRVTAISEPVFDNLNLSQSLQLTELMNRLEECNKKAVKLVIGLNKAIEFLQTVGYVFVPEQGSGSV